MPQEAREHVCLFTSSRCVNKLSLKELILSLHVALAKVDMDYLPDLKSNFLLYAQVVGGLFNACRVNFNALSHLKNAQLDFDIRFPFRATWEEFVEEWKNSSRLYFVDTPIETNVAPIAGCKEKDEELAEPNDSSANS
ncbi:hypothetical protein PVK06_048181 [Gossypium arboreum]|uniref:Uncharacterized protein n=1 Tax=Gossypium arboreum TaxID=29729 RepID=A0ABR0MFC3_GOSAR|nr:hypothetical protein PVK06_048181 [Gossypium arboreum]